MVSSFASGTNFDIVYVRDSFLAEWAAAGWIVPLTGLPGVDEYMADLLKGSLIKCHSRGKSTDCPTTLGTLSSFTMSAC